MADIGLIAGIPLTVTTPRVAEARLANSLGQTQGQFYRKLRSRIVLSNAIHGEHVAGFLERESSWSVQRA